MEKATDFILTPEQPQTKGFFDIRDRAAEMEKAERIRKIIGRINSRITDLQVLKGGWIMTNKAFRVVLSEHSELREEFEILSARKFRLERELWRVA